jgi:hypothetical protein
MRVCSYSNDELFDVVTRFETYIPYKYFRTTEQIPNQPDNGGNDNAGSGGGGMSGVGIFFLM